MNRRVVPRLIGLFMLASAVLGSKCVNYDERLTPGGGADGASDADGDGDPEPGDTTISDCLPPEPVFDLDAMMGVACTKTRCSGQRAASFWVDVWNDYDVVRIVRFRDDAPGPRFEITDEQGNPSDLAFVQGTPVTIILRNEGDSGVSRAYDFTAPVLFRHVAWRDVATSDGVYKSATFDAVLPGYTAGQRHEVVLSFVPIELGTFDVYSSGGVTNGTRYAAIADATVTPDLATGDAGQGMKTTVTITGGVTLALFSGTDIERDARLDDDPRRDATHSVWDPGNLRTVTIGASEVQDAVTGRYTLTFQWSSRAFPVSVGHLIELQNGSTNRFRHNFTANGLLRGSVNRALVDSQTEVRASAFDSVDVLVGKTIRIYFVPTVIARYGVFCNRGSTYSTNGQPDLGSGHAGAGMHDLVEVIP